MFDALLNASWLQSLMTLLIQVAMALSGILLLPISALIKTYIPDFDAGLEKLPLIFDYVIQYAGFVVQAFAIPPILITMLVGYYTFAVTTRLAFWSFKIALKWVKMIPGA